MQQALFNVSVSGVTMEEVKEKVAALAAGLGITGQHQAAPTSPQVDAPKAATTAALEGAVEAPVAEKKKRGRPAAEKQSAVSLVPDAEEAATEVDPFEIEVPATEAAPKLTVNQVRDLLNQVNTKLGTNKAIELLKKLGVNRLSELKEEKFGTFAAEANKLLAA